METEVGIEGTPTLVTKATGKRRDIDETLMQHDVRASREDVERRSPAMGPSIEKANPKMLHACQDTLWAAEELTQELMLNHRCWRVTAATSAWDAVMTLRTESNEGSRNDAEWRSSTSGFDPRLDGDVDRHWSSGVGWRRMKAWHEE